jgi:hypothetical protein
MIFRFIINFGYWQHIYLDLITQFKVTNLRHSKLLLKILVTHNMKNVISVKVRILGSNLFLTRDYSLIHIILMFFIWSGNHKFHIQFLRLLGLQSFIIVFEKSGPWLTNLPDAQE